MRYELLLQTGAAEAVYDAERVDAALERRGAKVLADGRRAWLLGSGEVEVRALREGGVIRATELRIPLSDRLELIRELVGEGAALAAELEVQLYDPQLGRTVGAKDDAAVAEQYLRTARYAGEMMGLPEAVAASFAPPEEGLKPGTKVLLGLGALLIALYWLLERLLLP